VSPEDDLGPLAARVPAALRAIAAYHVPQPPELRAKLDANELPYRMPAELRTRLGAVLAEVPIERYPDPAARELRAVVATQLGVAGDQLTFGNGSDELIALLCSAFEGGVLYPVPSFVYYRLAAVARGVAHIEVPLGAQFELDEAAMIRAIEAHRPGVVFLALPNNPTGTLWRMELALELAERFRDVAIVSDEAYLAYSGRTLLAELGAHPNLIIMRTLSKLGMAGLRVGYSIASPAIAALLERVRPPYNVSALDQAAAVFLLREASAWCAARAADVVIERGRLAAALAALPGIEVFSSAANLVMIRFASAAVAHKMLADRGISVRSFAVGPGPLVNCLRVTVGTPEENSQLIAALTDWGRLP
jgi:histidinol-phosphate aminotransferase